MVLCAAHRRLRMTVVGATVVSITLRRKSGKLYLLSAQGMGMFGPLEIKRLNQMSRSAFCVRAFSQPFQKGKKFHAIKLRS